MELPTLSVSIAPTGRAGGGLAWWNDLVGWHGGGGAGGGGAERMGNSMKTQGFSG